MTLLHVVVLSPCLSRVACVVLGVNDRGQLRNWATILLGPNSASRPFPHPTPQPWSSNTEDIFSSIKSRPNLESPICRNLSPSLLSGLSACLRLALPLALPHSRLLAPRRHPGDMLCSHLPETEVRHRRVVMELSVHAAAVSDASDWLPIWDDFSVRSVHLHDVLRLQKVVRNGKRLSEADHGMYVVPLGQDERSFWLDERVEPDRVPVSVAFWSLVRVGLVPPAEGDDLGRARHDSSVLQRKCTDVVLADVRFRCVSP